MIEVFIQRMSTNYSTHSHVEMIWGETCQIRLFVISDRMQFNNLLHFEVSIHSGLGRTYDSEKNTKIQDVAGGSLEDSYCTKMETLKREQIIHQ